MGEASVTRIERSDFRDPLFQHFAALNAAYLLQGP